MWTNESPRTYLAKSYSWLRLIQSVLTSSKFSVLKLLEIVILWVYYTIPFDFTLFMVFRAIIFNFWNHFIWLRITDKGSLPEMRIWSILFIKSEFKWCMHLSRSLFLYCKQTIEGHLYLDSTTQWRPAKWSTTTTKPIPRYHLIFSVPFVYTVCIFGLIRNKVWLTLKFMIQEK